MTREEFRQRLDEEQAKVKEEWGANRERDIARAIGSMPYALLFILILLAGLYG